ncbi:MAG TPA: polyprenol monophosphomannose synthase [Bacteroidota bacterium]
MANERALVVIPTYNEAENIPKLIPAILDQDPILEVLVVDDNSPDGTASLVRTLQKDNSRIHLLERPAKLGLGTAYVAGFRYALRDNFDYIIEMDADFSHDPKALKILLKSISDHDLVIGSRYISGVNVVNWPLRRLILSYSANIYTRMITGMPVKDATGGFKCYRRKVLESIDLDSLKSNGYAFQIETNFLAWRKGFRICEVPIIFVDRLVGVSKMSKHIIYEAAWMVWKLKLKSLLDGRG